LTGSKIAADRNRNLHYVHDLFDHGDAIFRSAFRNDEPPKFLHDSVKPFEPFWLKVGLRQRKNGLLDSADYLQCLQALSRRLTYRSLALDAQLDSDTQIVLSPLTSPSSSVQNFRVQDWFAISKVKVFRSQIDCNAEPEYRRASMASRATNQPLLPLAEVISHDYVAVC
jgi:hypothetical protein